MLEIKMRTDDEGLIRLVNLMSSEWTVEKIKIEDSISNSKSNLFIVDLRNSIDPDFVTHMTWIGIGETYEQNIWALEHNCVFFIPLPCGSMQLYYSIQCVQTALFDKQNLVVLPSGLVWNKATDELMHSHRHIAYLTPIESCILNLLWERHDTTVSIRQIIKEVWGPSVHARTDEVYVYIRSIRQKLQVDHRIPQMIRTKYKKGYILVTKILSEFSM